MHHPRSAPSKGRRSVDAAEQWRERALAAEARAAELARANDALRRGVDDVMQAYDLDSLVDGFLAEVIRVVEAKGGVIALRRRDTASVFDIAAGFDGRPLTRQEIRQHPVMGTFPEKSARDEDGVFSALARGESPMIRVANLAKHYPDGHDYHQARGERVIWHTPLRLRGEVLGFLAIALEEDAAPDEARQEVVEVMAQQLVLVLELSRLARESREEAVVLERDQARARQAAAEARQESALLGERARLAGQIHDTLAQGFTGTLLHLEAMIVRLRRGETISADELANVRKVAAYGLAEARRTAVVMRPLQLDRRSFLEGLQQLADRSNVPGWLTCELVVEGVAREVSPQLDEALLNIAHEAVNNVMRHAEARQVSITITFGPGMIGLAIRDDGRGFDADRAAANGHAFGLTSMRERAGLMGAEFKVASRPGGGTRVEVTYHDPE